MDTVKSLLASILLLSVLSLGAQTDLPPELGPTALTHQEVLALFDGDDPANWRPERVFEEYREKSYYNEWQKEAKQSHQLGRIIYRNPAVYGDLSAEILTEGTNPRLFGFAVDFVSFHPDKERAREAVLAFLSRTDIKPTDSIVNSAASTLAKVGRPEDAKTLLPFLENRPLAERQNLWMALVKFAGSEFLDLIEGDIAALEAMRNSGERGYSPETWNQWAAFLRHVKRGFEERLAEEELRGAAAANGLQPAAEGIEAGSVLSEAGNEADMESVPSPLPKSDSVSSRPWGIAVVLLMAALALLWVWLKKRK